MGLHYYANIVQKQWLFSQQCFLLGSSLRVVRHELQTITDSKITEMISYISNYIGKILSLSCSLSPKWLHDSYKISWKSLRRTKLNVLISFLWLHKELFGYVVKFISTALYRFSRETINSLKYAIRRWLQADSERRMSNASAVSRNRFMKI